MSGYKEVLYEYKSTKIQKYKNTKVYKRIPLYYMQITNMSDIIIVTIISFIGGIGIGILIGLLFFDKFLREGES